MPTALENGQRSSRLQETSLLVGAVRAIGRIRQHAKRIRSERRLGTGAITSGRGQYRAPVPVAHRLLVDWKRSTVELGHADCPRQWPALAGPDCSGRSFRGSSPRSAGANSSRPLGVSRVLIVFGPEG